MYTDPNSPKNDVLKWSTSGVATAVANGQDATQIAYHEYDHAYNTLADPGGTRSHRVPFPGDVDFPANGMASLTIGGSTFTYNLNVPSQWAAYEHGVVHNDLVAQFGSDKTGALTEAVAGAQNPLASGKSSSTAAAQFGKTNASTAATLSLAPHAYRYSGGCTAPGHTPSSARRITAPIGMVVNCPLALGTPAVICGGGDPTPTPTSNPTPAPTPVPTAAPPSGVLQPVDNYVYSWYTP